MMELFFLHGKEVSNFRCCLCPNNNKPANKTCPPFGSIRKETKPCRFVRTFVDNHNQKIFVAHGSAKYGYVAVRKNHRCEEVELKGLSSRRLFDEKQHDLNNLAKIKGWAVYE